MPLYPLCRRSIRHPKRTLVLAALVVMAAAPGVLRLKLRTDGHALVPADAPEVIYDKLIRDRFLVEDPIVVLIRSGGAEGIFNFDTLRLIETLTRSFQELDGVREENVVSLATEHTDRVWPGTLNFRRFLEPFPETKRDLERIRSDIFAIQLYTGTIVSQEGTESCILVGASSDHDRIALYRNILDLIEAQGDRPETIDVVGAPVAEALLGVHLLEDLGVPSSLLGGGGGSLTEPVPLRIPATLYELRLMVADHIGLVPVAIGIMVCVFFVTFASPLAAVLPLLEVGACLVFVFGMMGWSGVPVYLTIAVLPVILTAIGLADEIHIFARYEQILRRDRAANPIDALEETMQEMWVPIVKTSLTTAVGFLSFALSPLGPVRAFGVFTAVGILFCMLWSLLVTPALFTLVNPRHVFPRVWRGSSSKESRLTLMFSRLAGVVNRQRYALAAIGFLVLVVTPWGISRIIVQDSWIDGFAADSKFYRATQHLNEHFLGTHVLNICVDTGHYEYTGEISTSMVDHRTITFGADQFDDPQSMIGDRLTVTCCGGGVQPSTDKKGPRLGASWTSHIISAHVDGDVITFDMRREDGSPKFALRLTGNETVDYKIAPEYLTRPEVLRKLDELTVFIRSKENLAVGGALGPVDYLTTSNFMAKARQEGSRSLPENSKRIEWLWKQYRRIRGEERLRQAVDEHYSQALMTVFMKNANFVDTARLMADIRQYEKEYLEPEGIKLGFAGDVAVSQTLIAAIVNTQVWSLLLSLAGVLGVTALLGRSLGWGILCVFPCALAVLINFALMGFLAMPLGVATSMFAGMTLGIGVDYAIHLLERYRRSCKTGMERTQAINDAIASTGPAIFIDAIAIALGFGVLMLSQVPANARLGALVVFSIVNCFGATLVLLPAILALGRRSRSPDPPMQRPLT